MEHLHKILNFSYFLYAVGLVTAGWAALPWNPISGMLSGAVWCHVLQCVQCVAVCDSVFVVGCIALESYFWYAEFLVWCHL